MTNGPDEQQPGREPPPPPPPPPSGGGRGLFARNDPDQPGPLLPPRPQQPPREEPPQRQERPPREDPRLRQQQQPAGSDEYLLPNERAAGTALYGAAPPMPVVPLALMLLAIVVGGALFYMSMEDKKETGITPQQAAASLVLHMDGLDITEDAFRREIGTGIQKGRIPCDKLAGQPADNIAAGLKLGALKMEVPSASGVAPKNGQKADDASLLVAAMVVLDSCPKGAAPAPARQQPTNPPANPPGGTNPAPAGTQAPGGIQPAPAATQAPGGTNPAPAGTPRPATPAAPAPGR